MVDTVENLILDLLEWVGRRERSYQETMEVWRTSCPRLPVWEDATDRGLVETEHANGRSIVRVTPSGHALLKERRPRSDEGLWRVRVACKTVRRSFQTRSEDKIHRRAHNLLGLARHLQQLSDRDLR